MTDAEGNSLTVGQSVWYDDGTSPDWVNGTISAFNSTGMAIINGHAYSGGLIHVNKPPNPPDR